MGGRDKIDVDVGSRPEIVPEGLVGNNPEIVSERDDWMLERILVGTMPLDTSEAMLEMILDTSETDVGSSPTTDDTKLPTSDVIAETALET